MSGFAKTDGSGGGGGGGGAARRKMMVVVLESRLGLLEAAGLGWADSTVL
jgi:hypothetical protein